MSRRNDATLATWRMLQDRERVRSYFAQRASTQNSHASPESLLYSVERSVAPANLARNRYRDVLAYDRSGVRVDDAYLNANVVVDPVGNWWVAAQAPLPHTFHDFFRAIHTRAASASPALPPRPKPQTARKTSGGKANGSARSSPSRSTSGDAQTQTQTQSQTRSAILVQLTNWEERGFLKADPYLPDVEEEVVFTPQNSTDALRLRTAEQNARPDLGGTYSRLELEDDQTASTLHHYAFTEWPDHGVPEGGAVAALKNLLYEVYAQREALGGQDNCELWVHCSAGIGRTGAFLALLSLNFPPSRTPLSGTSPGLDAVTDIPGPEGDAVAATVDAMREWRFSLVQTVEQLELVYELSAGW